MILLIEKYALIILSKLKLNYDNENEESISKIKQKWILRKRKSSSWSIISQLNTDIDSNSYINKDIRFDINNNYVNERGDL